MATENPGARLGDLLTNAGLLKIEALREAMLTAKQQGMPVGRILITSGYLTENQLQAAVQAQSMLKDGLVDMYVVVKALAIIATEQTSLDNALARVGWRKQGDAVSNKLGELLLEANVISQGDLDHALTQCQTIGLPLGRMLVLTGCLSEQMLTNALNAQVFLRDKKISRQQALTGLKAAQHRQLPLETALDDSEFQLPSATHVRLGELLVEAGLVDQANLMNAVELGLLQDKLLGQVLLQLNLLSDLDLAAALELQKMVSNGGIRRADALELLKQCHREKADIQDVLKRKQPLERPAPPDTKDELFLDQFLKIAGIITQADIDKAIKIGSQNSDIFGKMLQSAGIMEEQMVEASLDAYALVSDNTLTMDQAMIALKNCQAKGHNLETAFKELGWAAEDDENESEDEDNYEPAETSAKTTTSEIREEIAPIADIQKSAVEAAPSREEFKPAASMVSRTNDQNAATDRIKTGSFSAIESTESVTPNKPASEPIAPTSQVADRANPVRSTSEHPIITPVVSKRTVEIEKSTLNQSTIESPKPSEERVAEKPAEEKLPERLTESPQPTQNKQDTPDKHEAKARKSPAAESVPVVEGGPPAWATPVEDFSTMTSKPPTQDVSKAQSQDFDQFSKTAEDMPVATPDSMLTNTSSFAPLKSAPPTKRRSQWLEAIREEPTPTIPPSSTASASQATTSSQNQSPPPAAPQPPVEAFVDNSKHPEPLPVPAESASSEPALAQANFNNVVNQFHRNETPSSAPPLPPPIAPQESSAANAAIPAAEPAPTQEPQPVAEAPKAPPVAPTIVPGRLSKALPQPASSLRNTGVQQPPGQSAWGFGSAQPPKSNPWDVTEEEEQTASITQPSQQQALQPALPATPAQEPAPMPAAIAPDPISVPPLAPTLAPTLVPSPVPPPAPTLIPDSMQPTVPMQQSPDMNPQSGGWGNTQKAPPPNPWAASQRASAEIAMPAGRPAASPTQLDMSLSNTAPLPQTFSEPPFAPPPNPFEPAPMTAQTEPVQTPVPAPIQAQAPAPSPAPAVTPYDQSGAPGWTSSATENPGWGSQSAQNEQSSLSSFSNNPGWRPSMPEAKIPPPAPETAPPPAPPLAPAPQPTAAAPTEQAKESWEYNGQEGAPPPKPKGLNAFMPKVKKDK